MVWLSYPTISIQPPFKGFQETTKDVELKQLHVNVDHSPPLYVYLCQVKTLDKKISGSGWATYLRPVPSFAQTLTAQALDPGALIKLNSGFSGWQQHGMRRERKRLKLELSVILPWNMSNIILCHPGVCGRVGSESQIKTILPWPYYTTQCVHTCSTHLCTRVFATLWTAGS